MQQSIYSKMSKYMCLYIIVLICSLIMQLTSAQEQQQQQVPVKNIGDIAHNVQHESKESSAAKAQQAIVTESPAVASDNNKAFVVPAVAGRLATEAKEQPVLVISEKTLSEHQAAQAAAHSKASEPIENKAISDAGTKTADIDDNSNKFPHETADSPQTGSNLMKMKSKIGLYTDMDDDSYKTASFFFLAISSVAIIFVAFKIYRMRLSRAERKYGVQGNRAAQELTPLPMAIDDGNGNSDDEDQTLFDRHQIRIL